MEIQLTVATNRLIEKADESKFVSAEVAKHVKKLLGALGLVFPQARKYLKAVRYTHSVTSSFEPWDRELHISVNGTGGSVADAQRLQSEGNKPGFIVHGGAHEAFDSLIVHEFAHCIDNCIKTKFKGDDDTQTAYQQEKRALQKAIGNPSPYAATRENEWFAEQFTVEWLGKGNGPLIKIILDYLNR